MGVAAELKRALSFAFLWMRVGWLRHIKISIDDLLGPVVYHQFMIMGVHGKLLMLTGVLHLVVGLLPKIYGKDWHLLFKLRLWKTVSVTADRSMAAFWFVMAGPLMFMAGLAIFELETHTSILPQSIGWVLLMISMLGAMMSPKSGFTLLLLPQAIFYLWHATNLSN